MHSMWKIGRIGAAALGAITVFILDHLTPAFHRATPAQEFPEPPSSSIAQSTPPDAQPPAKSIPSIQYILPATQPYSTVQELNTRSSVDDLTAPSLTERRPLLFYETGSITRLFTIPLSPVPPPSTPAPPDRQPALQLPVAIPLPAPENPFANLVYSGKVEVDQDMTALLEDSITHEGIWLRVGDSLRGYTVTELDGEHLALQKGQQFYTMPISSVINLVPLAQEAIAGVLPDPGNLTQYRGQDGSSYRFQVTGSVSGSVWGSGPYTDDSRLAVAAVHAGILRDGETGTVRVTILPGYSSYEGSARNGVNSNDYGVWLGSFRVSR